MGQAYECAVKLSCIQAYDPISILSSFHHFNTACNSNEMDERLAMWLCLHFMKDSVKAALAHWVCATEDEDLQKKPKLTSFCQILNYLLATYATGDVIAETKTEITKIKQAEYLSAVRYPEVLSEKRLRYGPVNEESRLKEGFIKELQESVKFLMKTFGAYITTRRSEVY